MSVGSRTLAGLLSVVLSGAVLSQAGAGGGAAGSADAKCGAAHCQAPGGCLGQRCHDCGCAADCCLVCRLVTKPKKVKVTCWKSECAPFCVPCPSQKGPAYAECVNCCEDEKGKSDGRCHGCLKKVAGFHWCPGDAKVDHKKKLLKMEKEVELKGVFEYKWEVVDLCAGCKEKSETNAPTVDRNAAVPAPPRTEAHMIYGKPAVERTALRDD